MLKILGLQIERKTDILALAAFLLALGGITYQIYGFLRGADVELFPSEQIFIIAAQYPEISERYVRFDARMAYINKGYPGYNAVIRSESIKYSLAGKNYEQKWQAFESFNIKQSKLISVYKDDAHPIPIMAGRAESHDTYFAPRTIRCAEDDVNCDKYKNYLTWDNFINFLSEPEIKELQFELVSEIYGGPTLNIKCTIEIDYNFMEQLKKTGWHAPSCWEY